MRPAPEVVPSAAFVERPPKATRASLEKPPVAGQSFWRLPGALATTIAVSARAALRRALLQGLHDLSAWVLPAPLPPDLLPDPDDLPFLELALTSDATLVTGNLRHFPSTRRRGVEVLEPVEALKKATG